MTSITSMPEEILLHIFSFVREPGSTSLVCSTWESLSNDEQFYTTILNTLKTIAGESVYNDILQEFVPLPASQKMAVVKQLFTGVYGKVKSLPNGEAFLKSIPDQFLSPTRLLASFEELEQLEMEADPESDYLFCKAVYKNALLQPGKEIPEHDFSHDMESLTVLEKLEAAKQAKTWLVDNKMWEKASSFLNIEGLGRLPRMIGQFSCVTSLSLENGNLNHLPFAIGHLSKLRTLMVLNNKLTAFPEAIGKLTNLTSIIADNNQISELPSALGQLQKLYSINILGNPLKRVHQDLLALPELDLFVFGQDTCRQWQKISPTDQPMISVGNELAAGYPLEHFLSLHGIEIKN